MADDTPRMQFWTKRHDRALEDMVRQQWMSPPAHPLRETVDEIDLEIMGVTQ